MESVVEKVTIPVIRSTSISETRELTLPYYTKGVSKGPNTSAYSRIDSIMAPGEGYHSLPVKALRLTKIVEHHFQGGFELLISYYKYGEVWDLLDVEIDSFGTTSSEEMFNLFLRAFGKQIKKLGVQDEMFKRVEKK